MIICKKLWIDYMILYQRTEDRIGKRASMTALTHDQLPMGRPRSAVDCPARPLHIVILVLTRPDAFTRRLAIRHTWMQEHNLRLVQVTMKFVLGAHNVTKQLLQRLQSENNMYRDILFLEELDDAYNRLSLKVVLALKWASQNLNFDYLLKTDDDVYVRVRLISKVLKEMNCQKMLYWGHLFLRPIPYRTGKWAELKFFNCETYYPYAGGGGYIISEKVLKTIMPYSESFALYNSEDVTVGNMLGPVNMQKRQDKRFKLYMTNSDCTDDFILTRMEGTDDHQFYVAHNRYLQNLSFCPEDIKVEQAIHKHE